MNAYGRAASARNQFEVAFGYDPSDPRETVTSSIPQALAMMNGPRVNLALRAIGRESVLGRLLDEIQDSKSLVEELYLRTLSREPTDEELDFAVKFVRSTGIHNSPLPRVPSSLVSRIESSDGPGSTR